MGALDSILPEWVTSRFSGYWDAAAGSNRRRTVTNTTMSSDDMLSQGNRQRHLVSEARDLQRNFSVVAWAIRQHLNYVTKFAFDSPNPELETAMAEWSRPLNCDVRGLHSLQRFIRLAEATRLRDGDLLIVKLSRGMLQAVEGDRLRNPPQRKPNEEWMMGVKLSRGGRPQRFSIYDRQQNSYSFDRIVPASNAWLLGYYQRFDQVRGVSPLTAAMAQFRDTYEGAEYQLARMKIAAALGLVITSSADQEYGYHSPQTEQPCGDGEETDENASRYPTVSMGAAPWQMEMLPGDEAKFLNIDTPGVNWREFWHEMLAAAIKSLDIPFSYYDGRGFNFSQSNAERLRYQRACEEKQADLIWLLDQITAWRLALWIADGDLPGRLQDYSWSWTPGGNPWWNPVDEIAAATQAIDAGLMSPQTWIRTNSVDGKSPEEVLDDIAEFNRMKEARDLPIVYTTRVQTVKQPEPPDEPLLPPAPSPVAPADQGEDDADSETNE